MPYKLRKAPGRLLYWVVNKETGEKYSKNPLPKERAEAQMRALYAYEGTKTLKGSATRAERGMAGFLREKYWWDGRLSQVLDFLNKVVHSHHLRPEPDSEYSAWVKARDETEAEELIADYCARKGIRPPRLHSGWELVAPAPAPAPAPPPNIADREAFPSLAPLRPKPPALPAPAPAPARPPTPPPARPPTPPPEWQTVGREVLPAPVEEPVEEAQPASLPLSLQLDDDDEVALPPPAPRPPTPPPAPVVSQVDKDRRIHGDRIMKELRRLKKENDGLKALGEEIVALDEKKQLSETRQRGMFSDYEDEKEKLAEDEKKLEAQFNQSQKLLDMYQASTGAVRERLDAKNSLASITAKAKEVEKEVMKLPARRRALEVKGRDVDSSLAKHHALQTELQKEKDRFKKGVANFNHYIGTQNLGTAWKAWKSAGFPDDKDFVFNMLEAREGSGIKGGRSWTEYVAHKFYDVARGIRVGYSPSSRKTLEKYGGLKIVGLKARRVPIQSMLHSALNLLTAGKWDKARAETNQDKLFHLGIVITLAGQKPVYVIAEKNEVVNIALTQPVVGGSETVSLPTPLNTTLSQFLERGEKSMGADKYFKYDAFSNNCQDYVGALLSANRVYPAYAKQFVKQPVDNLLSKLPSWTQAVAKVATDVAGLANVAIEGRGFAESPTPPNPLLRVGSKLAKQLKEAELSPSSYLDEARRRAKSHGYPSKLLGFSDDGIHKLAIPNPEGKIIRFGRAGYGDHLIWSALERSHKAPSGKASQKQQTFHKSHSKIKGNWREDLFSPNNLALKILW